MSQWSCITLLALVAVPRPAHTQEFRQTQTDDYTRYELLDPATHSFRILYDVSATSAGARFYFNAIREGAEPTVQRVTDLMTGQPLQWRIASGAEARAAGMTNANASGRYIQVTLARPVPDGGQARVRIDKTYRDTVSYRRQGDGILFDRSLGIDRNAIVLPAGYELTACNYPSQVAQEADGRIRISFMNRGPAAVPLRIEAVPLARNQARTNVAAPARATSAAAPAAASTAAARARVDYTFSERAFENRDITYFLHQPETHSFRLFHDYTETRSGTDRYVNVVRAGSKASAAEAVLLDTGERLAVETLRGQAIRERGVQLESITAESEVVLITFPPVREGGSARLRITETYTDPDRYLQHGEELVWDRSLGRPRNTVVLPEGWYLTANAVPAVIDRLPDRRIRLRYVNDRPGEIDVIIKAKRR
jgi:hypothetical protein